jgi:hypothetical protein
MRAGCPPPKMFALCFSSDSASAHSEPGSSGRAGRPEGVVGRAVRRARYAGWRTVGDRGRVRVASRKVSAPPIHRALYGLRRTGLTD